MKKYVLVPFCLILGFSCKKEPPVEPPSEPTITLKAEDASCTEAWLKVTTTETHATVRLLRDNQRISDLRLLTSDSLLFDEGLFPNHTYTYQLQKLAERYRTQKQGRLKSGGTLPQMSPASIRVTDVALININHPWTSTPVINANVTVNQLQRRLFSDDAVLAFNALYFNSPNPEQAVALFVDPEWNRVIYANKSQDWIKSYGERNGPPRYEISSCRCKGANS